MIAFGLTPVLLAQAPARILPAGGVLVLRAGLTP
jgi:hypothetical protein